MLKREYFTTAVLQPSRTTTLRIAANLQIYTVTRKADYSKLQKDSAYLEGSDTDAAFEFLLFPYTVQI